MKYRKIILFAFVALVGVSLIYGLSDHRQVTTTSENAYQAYLKGKDYSYRLYNKEALAEFERAVQFDPNFAMALAREAWLYKSFDRKSDYEAAKTKALGLLGGVTDKERIIINLGFAQTDNRQIDLDRYTKELLQKYPESIEALEYQSGKAFDEKNYDKAIEINLSLLRKDPNHCTSLNLLGYSYFYKGEYDKALDYINKYAESAKDQANPQDSHGELLLDLGRYDEALEQFNKADSIKPDLSFVISHIANTYFAKGMYREAIAEDQKARDLWPAESYKAAIDGDIAWSYIQMGQIEKATALLAELLSRSPDDIRANAILGGIYAAEGKIADATIQLNAVEKLVKKFAEEHPGPTMDRVPPVKAQYYLSSRIALEKGDYKTAIQDSKEMCVGVGLPDKMFFTSLLGDAYVKANQPDSAIAVLTDALRDNPNDGFCLKVLAQAYKLNGQREAEKGALLRYLNVMKDADDGMPGLIEANDELKNINSATS